MTTTEPATDETEPGVEPGTELEAVPQPQAVAIAAPSRAEWDLLLEQATQLSASNLVPMAYRGKPGELLACSLMARELGRGLMWGLRHLWVSPDGKVGTSAEGMVGLVIAAGYDIWPVEVNREHAVVGWRRDGREGTMEYHIDEAVAAGLVEIRDGKPYARSDKGKPMPWEKFTGDMLWARGASRTVRRIYPDVLGGAAYVPEEIGARVNPETGEVDAGGYKTITVEEARNLRSRASDLSDAGKDKLRAALREMGVVLYRGRDTEAAPLEPILPATGLDKVEEMLAGIEAEEPKPSDTPPAADDEPAEGVVVGEDPHPPDPEGAAAEEAEIVTEPAADEPPPAPESIDSRPPVEAPAGPFNGDTGHCSACGGPVWYAVDPKDGGPGWLHADPDDSALPVHATEIRPAAEGVDVDKVYAAARVPVPAEQLRARVEAAVKALSPTAVLRELAMSNLSPNGPPAQCAARLIEHRVAVASKAS